MLRGRRGGPLRSVACAGPVAAATTRCNWPRRSGWSCCRSTSWADPTRGRSQSPRRPRRRRHRA